MFPLKLPRQVPKRPRILLQSRKATLPQTCRLQDRWMPTLKNDGAEMVVLRVMFDLVTRRMSTELA